MDDAVTDYESSRRVREEVTASLNAQDDLEPARSRLTPQTARIALETPSKSCLFRDEIVVAAAMQATDELDKTQTHTGSTTMETHSHFTAIFTDGDAENEQIDHAFGSVFSVDATTAASIESTLMQPEPRTARRQAATSTSSRPLRARRALNLMDRLDAEDETSGTKEIASGFTTRKRTATESEAESATAHHSEDNGLDAGCAVRRTWKRRLDGVATGTETGVMASRVTPGPASEERPRPVFMRAYSSQSVFLSRPKMTMSQPTDDAHSAAIASKLHELVLPTVRSSSHPDLNVISPQTVADLLDGVYGGQLDSFSLIDCRFDYEFQGGNLKGSVSMNDPAIVEDHFLRKPPVNSIRTALIFYCEFSANRAPKMLRHVRNLDRWIHAERYPELFYPELYLIDGGYKNCFEKLKDVLCSPAQYRTMSDKAFVDQCKSSFAIHRAKWKNHKSNGCASRFQQVHHQLHSTGSSGIAADLDDHDDDDDDDAAAVTALDDALLPPLARPVNMRSISQQL